MISEFESLNLEDAWEKKCRPAVSVINFNKRKTSGQIKTTARNSQDNCLSFGLTQRKKTFVSQPADADFPGSTKGSED